MRNIFFFLIVVCVFQLSNAQLNEVSVDSIRKDHQAKVDSNIFYVINSTKYKDFIIASPLSKYGIFSIQGHRKRVKIPFVFSDVYYEKDVSYGKIDSTWYKVDRANAKVYELSSQKQNTIKEQYAKIEWGTKSPQIKSDDNTGTELGGDSDYQVGGRKALDKPHPQQECNEVGIVVVSVEIDRSGKVIKAIPGIRGSTNTSQCLLEPTMKAALATRFSNDDNAPSKQKGKIVYRF